MVSLSTFRLSFKEFRSISDPEVQLALDQAERRTDASVLGDLTDEYHGNRAADILASKPSGASARQVPASKDEVNVYARKCDELTMLTCAFRGVL